MTMRIYNTLTNSFEEFKPLEEMVVKMYSCGVTTYDEIHLGHARQAVVFDVIRNYFEFLGYRVDYVRNYTDIDDKIIKRAAEKNKQWFEISDFYIAESKKDLTALKVRPATFEPKVTENIFEIIDYIKILVDKGFAYEGNEDVLFDVSQDKEYGKLSNRKIDELITEKETKGKRNPQDFSLWKAAKEGEPSWSSPWGSGRPGWHIECSVLAKKYLGEKLDIHGGGIDLLFPHHENEIAQSESCCGTKFVNYWVHNGLVLINGQKMSKSLGNFLTVKDTLKKQTADEIRYVILVHNYGSQIDFTEELFIEARKRLYYFYKTLSKIEPYKQAGSVNVGVIPAEIKDLVDDFIAAMNDNFNTAKVIASLSSVFSRLNDIIESKTMVQEEKNSIYRVFWSGFNKITKVLGLFDESPVEYLEKMQTFFFAEHDISIGHIDGLLAERNVAREKKDYIKADLIRGELSRMRINIKDKIGGGTTWELFF